MDKPPVPTDLQDSGRDLWRSVVDVYELRADELLLLEKACRTADDSARLDRAVATSDLVVTGSMGQQRQNPLLNEARQTRSLLAALLKQLALSDGDEDVKAQSRSWKATAAARARWRYGA